MATAWTRDENEIIVADYFTMLEAELSGRPYSKAEHNRGIQRRIGRNKGSIEFKHQNTSVVSLKKSCTSAAEPVRCANAKETPSQASDAD